MGKLTSDDVGAGEMSAKVLLTTKLAEMTPFLQFIAERCGA